MTIAACIIAYNEEACLPAALSALTWVDEIVLVDCESSDGTADVARKYTERIFTRPNLPNLNVNKNFSFDQAASDWLLCLDADEVVGGALAREIRERIAADPLENGFFIKRRNRYFGKVLLRGGHFPDRQLRLFRRGTGRFPARHVHERLEVRGRVGTLREPMDHTPYCTVSQYLVKMDFYTSFEARRLFEEGRRFSSWSFSLELCRGKARFFRRYLLKGGFRDGWQGFAAAYLDFLSRVVVQLKLRELDRKT